MAREFPEIKAGNALMYYPEANVLVSRGVDPASRTPAFKCVLVTIEPQHQPSAARGKPATAAV